MQTEVAVIEALEHAPEIVVPLVREVPATVLKRRPATDKWSAHEHACHLAVVHRLFFDRLDQMLATPSPVITPYDPGQSDPDVLLLGMELDRALDQYMSDRRRLVARLRQEIPRGDLLQALTAGVEVPAPIIDTIYRYRTETRVADLVTVPLSSASDVGTPSDADIQKFYDDHQDMFKSVEYRGFLLASMTVGDLAGDIHVTDEQLKSAYVDHKDELAIPEQRQVEQILAPSEDKAKAAEAALAAGQDFKDVATKIAGQDPQTIDLGLVKANDLPKPVADAVFDLPLDKPSQPIQDPLGWHILRVSKIEPPKTPSFEEAKQQLTDELTQDAEADRLDHVANEVDDALAELAFLFGWTVGGPLDPSDPQMGLLGQPNQVRQHPRPRRVLLHLAEHDVAGLERSPDR